MTHLQNLRAEVERTYKMYRRLSYFINQEPFGDAWDEASEEQKDDVLDLIDKLDVDGVRKWVTDMMHAEFGEKSLRELRELGARHRIPYVNSLTKNELIQEVSSAVRRYRKRVDQLNKSASCGDERVDPPSGGEREEVRPSNQKDT